MAPRPTARTDSRKPPAQNAKSFGPPARDSARRNPPPPRAPPASAQKERRSSNVSVNSGGRKSSVSSASSKVPAWMSEIRGAPPVDPEAENKKSQADISAKSKAGINPQRASMIHRAGKDTRYQRSNDRERSPSRTSANSSTSAKAAPAGATESSSIRRSGPLPAQNIAIIQGEKAKKKPAKVVKPTVSEKTRKIIKDITLVATKLKEDLLNKTKNYASMAPVFSMSKSTNDMVAEFAKKITPEEASKNPFVVTQTSSLEKLRKVININNEPNKFFITRPDILEKLIQDTGAEITTGGKYYPNLALVSQDVPPLYIKISASSEEILQKGEDAVREILGRDPVRLKKSSKFSLTDDEYKELLKERAAAGINIPIEIPTVSKINVFHKIIGKKGENIKHINVATDCKVRVKGIGSGFIDAFSKEEEDVPLYFHILGETEEQLVAAREMCIDLLNYVKEEMNEVIEKKKEKAEKKKEKKKLKKAQEGSGDNKDSEGSDSDDNDDDGKEIGENGETANTSIPQSNAPSSSSGISKAANGEEGGKRKSTASTQPKEDDDGSDTDD